MNGLQAMDELSVDDRKLLIKTKNTRDNVSVFVEDWGIGIAPDKIDHIFEPLVTWKPGGTGMGLAISNSIIESHRGKLNAVNKHTGGAIVSFSIPGLK